MDNNYKLLRTRAQLSVLRDLQKEYGHKTLNNVVDSLDAIVKHYEKPAIMMMAIECEVMQGFSGGPNAGDAENPNGPSNGGGGPGATDVEDPDGKHYFSVWED